MKPRSPAATRLAPPVLLILALCLCPPLSTAQQAPPGWRALLPTDPGTDPERVALIDTQVRGDFNGDGRRDHARMLVRTTAPGGRAIFVFLGQDSGQPTSEKLLTCPAATQCADHVLAIAHAGCYRETMSNTPVCLPHDGLVLSEIEFGFGTLFWLEHAVWRHLAFGQGSLQAMPP